MKLVLQPPENLGSAGWWDSWARRRTAGVVVPHQGVPTTTRDPTGPPCGRTPALRWLRYRSSQYPDIPPLSALPAQSWRSLILNFQVVGALVLRTFQSLLLLSVVCGVVHAQDRPSKPSLPKAERSAISSGLLGSSRSNKAVGVSLRQAMALAREDTGGRVLSSKSFNSGNQGAQIHQIRLLVDGERVVTVVVDAKGRVRRR